MNNLLAGLFTVLIIWAFAVLFFGKFDPGCEPGYVWVTEPNLHATRNGRCVKDPKIRTEIEEQKE